MGRARSITALGHRQAPPVDLRSGLLQGLATYVAPTGRNRTSCRAFCNDLPTRQWPPRTGLTMRLSWYRHPKAPSLGFS